MQMVKLKFNMIVDNSPHVINTLDGSAKHPLIRKLLHLPKANITLLQAFETEMVFSLSLSQPIS